MITDKINPLKEITILIADDHKLLRETLGLLINTVPGFKVIASCEDSEQAVEIAKTEQPDIVLMDINIKPFSGIEATKKISSNSSSMVIGMSVHSDPAYAKKMLKMGAKGYITKNSPKDEIFSAMRKVAKGETYVCQEIRNILCNFLMEETRPDNGINSLTDREMQIAQLIRQGFSSKEIAEEMNISLKTVEVHRHNMLKKLKLKNAASLVNYIHNNHVNAG